MIREFADFNRKLIHEKYLQVLKAMESESKNGV